MSNRVNLIRLIRFTVAVLVLGIIVSGIVDSANQEVVYTEEVVYTPDNGNNLHLNTNTTKTVVITKTLNTFTYTKTTSDTDADFGDDPIQYMIDNSLFTIIVIFLFAMIIYQFRSSKK